MSDQEDPKKDETTKESTDDSGCDCSCCPGCGSAPEKPKTEDEE